METARIGKLQDLLQLYCEGAVQVFGPFRPVGAVQNCDTLNTDWGFNNNFP